MNIKVKNKNNKLYFIFDELCQFDVLLDELEKLLDCPLFNKSEHYPEAFFDFRSRFIQENDIYALLLLLNKKEKVLFGGICQSDYNKDDYKEYLSEVRAGEEVYVYDKTLFLKPVHAGAYIYCFDDVFFCEKVSGIVVSYKKDIQIYGKEFDNASLYICDHYKHNVTINSLCLIYYNDKDLCMEVKKNEQNNCNDFRKRWSGEEYSQCKYGI